MNREREEFFNSEEHYRYYMTLEILESDYNTYTEEELDEMDTKEIEQIRIDLQGLEFDEDIEEMGTLEIYGNFGIALEN